jgi:hypothetical protein
MARVVAAIVFCALFTGIAIAADAPGQRPCKPDMEKYCADALGDRAKMGDCMKAHFQDFSAACQARINQRREMHQENGGPMSSPTRQGSTATQSPPVQLDGTSPPVAP